MRRAACGFAVLFALAARGDDRIDRWLSGAAGADLKWSVRAERAELSRFQRLTSRLVIRVDGSEIEKRRGRGRLLCIYSVRDAAGQQYEDHVILDLRKPPYSEATNLGYLEGVDVAFFVPGDYQVTFALVDLQTREHNLARRKLRVAPISGDPAQDAWRGLPAVEFELPASPPESWFMPKIRSGLSLSVESERPVRVEVVMNASTSEISRAAQLRSERSRAALIAALKALAQIDVRNGTLNVSVLDVARRESLFRQESVTRLDWAALETALKGDNPNRIDARALKERKLEVQFFLDEIRRRLAPDEKNSRAAVIVLSAPMAFPADTDRKPIEPAAGGDARLFYIRYQTILTRSPAASFDDFMESPRRAPFGSMDTLAHATVLGGVLDQLGATLKPLHPHAFEVWSPMDFRKAAVEIAREIAK